MRSDEKKVHAAGTHVVFDFTGLHSLDVADLALILTARLVSGTDGPVWVRGVPARTAHVLRALGLGHLFRPYPASETLH